MFTVVWSMTYSSHWERGCETGSGDCLSSPGTFCSVLFCVGCQLLNWIFLLREMWKNDNSNDWTQFKGHDVCNYVSIHLLFLQYMRLQLMFCSAIPWCLIISNSYIAKTANCKSLKLMSLSQFNKPGAQDSAVCLCSILTPKEYNYLHGVGAKDHESCFIYNNGVRINCTSCCCQIAH